MRGERLGETNGDVTKTGFGLEQKVKSDPVLGNEGIK
uniref:Uncharacterized protein n=1 Tax=Arundo donax TaxID=35708 RepID=A0A0A9BVC9_ARUDO